MGVAAAVEGRIAGGIDQHAVTGGREIERGGRVAVAGVGGRVAVDPERPFFAGVAQAFEVEAEPVDILSGSERQFEAAAAAADGEFDPSLRAGAVLHTSVAMACRFRAARSGTGKHRVKIP